MSNAVIKPLTRLATVINLISESIGRLTAWLVVLLILLICYDVAMRYLFQKGSVAIQEMQWHLFALIFLLGGAYTLKHNEHVRVDVFFQSRWMSPRKRALVDCCGCLLFLIPFCALMIYSAIPFVEQSWNWKEASPDPGGLPARWLLKAMIPTGFALLMLQGFAMAIDNLVIVLSPDTHTEEHA